MTSIDPTVARSVWFSPSAVDSELWRDDGPYAAIICKAWESGAVNVAVFDRHGHSVGRQRVPMLQGGQFPLNPEAAFCTWMPYQIGQAAKTDENTTTLMRALNTQAALIQAMETRVDALTARIGVLEADAAKRAAVDSFYPSNPVGQVLRGMATAQLTGTNTDQIYACASMGKQGPGA